MKRCLQTHASLTWSWCISHGLNAAIKSVYGRCEDFLALVCRVKETVNFVRSKETLGNLFAELARKIGSGNKTALKGFQEHRFIGIFPVLVRLDELFDAVLQFYEKSKAPCPVEYDREAIKEIIKILAVVHGICTEAQSNKIGSGAKAMKHILDLAVGGKYRGTTEQRRIWDLESRKPVTTEFLRSLKDALVDRFYLALSKSNAESQNHLHFYAQMYLMPTSRDLEAVRAVFVEFTYGGRAFEQFQTLVRNYIVKIGEGIALNSNDTQWYDDDSFAFSHGDVSGVSGELNHVAATPYTRIENELHKYENNLIGTVKSYADVGTFWLKKSMQFPILSRVAIVVFSSPGSSGGIERDFGSSSRLITKQRCSLADVSVDMAMVINANNELIDLDQLKQFSEEEMQSAMPKKFLILFSSTGMTQTILTLRITSSRENA